MNGSQANERPGRLPGQVAFGQAVREVRGRRGISQENLAEIAGLHRNHVSALERGERNPTLSTQRKVATGLSIALSRLVALAERRDREAR